ncbi:MAG: FliH/SctL family protein [Bryobacteraceae bacterium]
MSSRILREARQDEVSPVVWPCLASGNLESRQSKTLTGQANQVEDIERRVREAHKAGQREGETAVRAQIAPIIEQLARSIESLASLRPSLRRQAEEDVVRLALAIARRVIRRELTVDPEPLGGIVRTALEKLQGQEICRVRVWPEHEATLKHTLERLGAPSGIEIVADRSRQPGDVLFETARGVLDASIETQLQEVERGLADRLHRR